MATQRRTERGSQGVPHLHHCSRSGPLPGGDGLASCCCKGRRQGGESECFLGLVKVSSPACCYCFHQLWGLF